MAKQTYENHDYAKMLVRLIRAYGKRAADGDELDLADLVTIRQALDEAELRIVEGQRARFSWRTIATGLGIDVATAHRRYTKAPPTSK
jgi:hypothetical protein